jgi:Protein of unknown function (DUF3168)
MSVVNFKGALRSYLESDPAVLSLVGQKIYSPKAPQGVTGEYIVFSKVNKMELEKLDSAPGVVEERYQIDAYSSDVDKAEEIARAVRDRMQLKNHENWSGYKVYLSRQENENDLSELEIEGAETDIGRIQQDFYIKRSYAKN